ncbi:MAG: hypothetical protein V4523_07860 [Pseudomonadota bacterium]
MRVDLRSRLKANATITGIVGTAIDWNRRTGMPALVLYNISPGRAYTHSGATGLSGSRVQFDCMSKSLPQAEALFNAVLAEMEQAKTVGTTAFSMSFLDSQRDMQTVDIDGVGAVGGISADFFVWWKPI